MVVGACHIRLIIHDNHSLKGKRMVLKKVIDGVKNRFNVSVAEVGSQDLWQRAEVGVAAVGTDSATLNSLFDKIINFVEDLHVAELAQYEYEFTNVSLLPE